MPRDGGMRSPVYARALRPVSFHALLDAFIAAALQACPRKDKVFEAKESFRAVTQMINRRRSEDAAGCCD